MLSRSVQVKFFNGKNSYGNFPWISNFLFQVNLNTVMLCPIIHESSMTCAAAKRSWLTFHCLWSFLTASCRPCCSCSGRMSVSSSQAFRKALSTRWSSWLKNSWRGGGGGGQWVQALGRGKAASDTAGKWAHLWTSLLASRCPLQTFWQLLFFLQEYTIIIYSYESEPTTSKIQIVPFFKSRKTPLQFSNLAEYSGRPVGNPKTLIPWG